VHLATLPSFPTRRSSDLEHPQMFRAVASLVGIYDMLRVERDPNGAFNTTEFGSTVNPDQFKALLAYSPYHHVEKGARYPAVFMRSEEHTSELQSRFDLVC